VIQSPARALIWLKSRQIGCSFAFAYDALETGYRIPGIEAYLLSRTERQSKKLMEKVKLHQRAFEVLGFPGLKRDTTLEIELYNGSVITALPADPDTVRGFTGNIYLDEFAFHKDPRKIYQAIMPAMSRGKLRVRIGSTPLGDSGLFYDIWTGNTPEKFIKWDRVKTDVYEAIDDGCPINLDEIREICVDPDIFAQEYECQFIADAVSYFPYELILTCLADDEPVKGDGPVYIGVDVGRKRDLTVIYVIKQIGDVFHTIEITRLRKKTIPVQELECEQVIAKYSPLRVCIDETGLGAGLVDYLRKKFGSRIEGVTFSAAVKEEMAVDTKRHFEKRTVRIPEDRDLINAIHSIRKEVTSAGNVRFDADRTDRGHADEFWALALALHAAKRPAEPKIYFL